MASSNYAFPHGKSAVAYGKLAIAASKEDLEQLDNLVLKEGIPVDLDAGPANAGFTVLIEAAGWGRTASVKRLLELGADVNKKTVRFGYTPLILALKNGHSETVDILIEAGAEISTEELVKLIRGNFITLERANEVRKAIAHWRKRNAIRGWIHTPMAGGKRRAHRQTHRKRSRRTHTRRR